MYYMVCLTTPYIFTKAVEKYNMTVECGICGEPLKKLREADFMRYRCAHCQLFYYVYAPAEPPHLTRTSQKLEKPSIFALLFPFMVVTILEVLYHLFV